MNRYRHSVFFRYRLLLTIRLVGTLFAAWVPGGCSRLAGQTSSLLLGRRLVQVPVSGIDRFTQTQVSLPGGKGLPDWPTHPTAGGGLQIDSVVIAEERETTLTIEVYGSGVRDSALRGEVLDRTQKRQSQIPVAQASSEMDPATLTFRAALPETGSLQSAFLRLTGAGKVFLFQLNKQWSKGLNPENQLVYASLSPVGSAAKLLQQPSQELPLPGKSVGTQTHGPVVPLVYPSQWTPIPTGTGQSLSGGIPDKNPKGPRPEVVSLWDDLRADLDITPTDLATIKLDLHPDRNPASGVYYYIPNRYYLDWSPEQGYTGFRMLYGTASPGNKPGEVRMYASLTPGVSLQERAFIEKLLVAYHTRNRISVKPVLRMLPSATPPEVRLQGELVSQYEVQPNTVSVNASTDLSDAIRVSWVTDVRTKEEMVVALLENVGINGSVLLRPDSLPAQVVPLTLQLASPSTFGRFTLTSQTWRKQPLRNTTPYPLRFTYMHVLLLRPENNQTVPYLYSWKVDGGEVPPQGRVQLDDTRVPFWLDNSPDVLRVWLDYSVTPCRSCNELIVRQLMGGTSGEQEKIIRFKSMGMLAQYNAEILQITLRSKQADPKGEQVVEKTATTREDDQEITLGPLFVQGNEALGYEYKVSLISRDRTREGKYWIPARDPEIFINRSVIERSLGESLSR